tara:strand:- start:179 stop:394 length:216 start_codon:yes stop_codon:yes gene_type:complete
MKKFLDLGLQPLANKYLSKKDLASKRKEQLYHLEVGFDNKTKLVSILNKVKYLLRKCLTIIILIDLQCLKQ